MATLTRQAVGFRLRHSRRRGQDWTDFTDSPLLAPVQVREAMAPKVSTAKIHSRPFDDAEAVVIWPWDWRRICAFDDKVQIFTDHADAGERIALFAGFVVDVDWTFTRSGQIAVTAKANAWRLARDRQYVVHGRYMLTKAASVAHFSGLPCVFNAGGKPNRHPSLQADIDCYATTVYGGVPVFTADDAAGAVHWTFGAILHYLMWRYNAAETYVANAELPADDYEPAAPIVADCQGRSLWAALGESAGRSGYDLYEQFQYGAETADSQIAVIRRHNGTRRTVAHQAPNDDGSLPGVDLDHTDLFSGSFAESVSSCVNAPVVAGGRRLYEITIPLQPAWDAARLAIPSGSYIVPPSKGGGTRFMTSQDYCKRYVAGGGQFHLYADCGRLWDANTDGAYSAAPYSAAVPDVAALCGLEAGSWPLMAFAALDCLTTPSAVLLGDAKAFGPYVEISFDSGTTWQPIEAALMPGRLAVRLQQANLAQVAAAGQAERWNWNLFARLAVAPATVRMRLTCTIAGPDRNMADQTPTTGGSIFEMSGFFERSELGQSRSVASCSRFFGQGLSADQTAGSVADLTRAAEKVTAAHAQRLIEASVPIEWPDEEIALGDEITRITGIESDLGTMIGALWRYPRVVGITRNLTPGTYSMVLDLDTERKAGSV